MRVWHLWNKENYLLKKERKQSENRLLTKCTTLPALFKASTAWPCENILRQDAIDGNDDVIHPVGD